MQCDAPHQAILGCHGAAALLLIALRLDQQDMPPWGGRWHDNPWRVTEFGESLERNRGRCGTVGTRVAVAGLARFLVGRAASCARVSASLRPVAAVRTRRPPA
ncbi:hypothetical protein GCM10027167_75970 [Nocardia heshunensis]